VHTSQVSRDKSSNRNVFNAKEMESGKEAPQAWQPQSTLFAEFFLERGSVAEKGIPSPFPSVPWTPK